MPRDLNCICPMPPGHEYPNQSEYAIDHRCPLHGEATLPRVWGRHKELQLRLNVQVYKILAALRQHNEKE